MTLRLGEILIGRRLISAAQLERALAEQRASGGRLGEILVRRGDLRPRDLRAALAEQSRSFLLAAALLMNGGLSAGTPAFVASQDGARAAQAQGQAVGTALRVAGRVEAVDPEGARRALEPGDPLFEGDIVETGPEAEMRALFADGSTLTIGPNASAILDRFVYDPSPGVAGRATASAKGALRALSGGSAPPEAHEGATAGVRG